MNSFEGKKQEFFLLFALVFGLAGAIIWVRTATVKATYLYVQHQKELVKLQQDLQSIRVQWLRLTSPKRLDTLAMQLGLTPPRVDQVMQYEGTRLSSERRRIR